MENFPVTFLVSHAKRALELVEPSILKTIEVSEGRNSLHAIIVSPHESFSERHDCREPRSAPTIGNRTYGEQNPAKWTRNFVRIAMEKAFISWRTGMSTRTVGEKAPYLYQDGDVKYPGGVVCDGLIVACSGLDWWWDEACAHMIIANFWASVRQSREAAMADADLETF